MPLLTSPIDGSAMKQIHRYGIEIDICPSSGGVWLDRGELEKLIHLLQEEASMEQSDFPTRSRDNRYWEDEDNRYKRKGYYGSGKYYKKKNKLSKVMDLFDF